MTRSSMIMAALLLAGTASAARADVARLAPSQAIALPADISGSSKAAFLFDLSGLRSGEGRAVSEAYLVWRKDDVPSDRTSRYELRTITASWTSVLAAQGTPLSVSGGAISDWEVEPLDYERNEGGLLRLDVTSLVQNWLSGATSNNGVLLSTPDISSTDLAGDLEDARLVIRYGFVPN